MAKSIALVISGVFLVLAVNGRAEANDIQLGVGQSISVGGDTISCGGQSSGGTIQLFSADECDSAFYITSVPVGDTRACQDKAKALGNPGVEAVLVNGVCQNLLDTTDFVTDCIRFD